MNKSEQAAVTTGYDSNDRNCIYIDDSIPVQALRCGLHFSIQLHAQKGESGMGISRAALAPLRCACATNTYNLSLF